jgi:hypothetical protein
MTAPWARSRGIVLLSAAAVLVSMLAAAQPASAATGTWTTVAPSGFPQQEVSYAEADGRLYLLGWMNDTQRAYDPTSDMWSIVAPLPAPKPLNHIQVAAVGGKVYYIGGFLSWPTVTVGSVYVYDAATNTFTTGASLPAGRDRGAGAVAVANGKIYLAGGVHAGTTVPWFDAYDPATDSWSALPDLPHARNHFQGAVVGDRFWAIGGRSTAQATSWVGYNEAFDFTAGTWTAGFAPLPTLRSGTAAAVFGSEVAVIGGEGGGGVFHTVEAYDTATDTWRTLAPMPTARHGFMAAMWQGAAYLAGGGIRQGGGSGTDVQEVLSLTAIPRPDAQVKLAGQTSFAGNDVYNTTGAGQTRSTTSGDGQRRTFVVRMQNDGTDADGTRVHGCSAAAGFAVRYLAGTSGTTDITAAVLAGTYTLPGIAPGGSGSIRLVVTTGAATASGKVQACPVTGASQVSPAITDTVLARVTVP